MDSAGRSLYPHEMLLLSCVGGAHASDAQQRIEEALSAPGLDWPTVLRTAIQHGVIAMLAWRLRAFTNDPRIPDSIAAILERIRRALVARNEAMFTAAGRLIHALDQAGIPSLVLKGIGLALTVYPEPGLRSFADIDIVVPEAQWEAAGKVAEEVGFLLDSEDVTPQDYHLPYVLRVSEDILSDTLVPEFEPKHQTEALGEAAHRIVVEIHRSVFILPDGFGRDVDMQPFWENAQTIPLPDGTPIRIPAPEVMLTHLASHANRHSYWRLYFAMDIVQAIRTWGPALDWDLLAAHADRYAARNAVYRMLELAQREFAAAVPPAVLKQLNPGPNAGPAGEPLQTAEIFGAMELVQQEPSAVTWRLLLIERSLKKSLVSAGRILFPAPSIMRRYYHVESPLLMAGCYLIRPFQLLGRLIRVLCRMAATRMLRARRVSLAPSGQDSP